MKGRVTLLTLLLLLASSMTAYGAVTLTARVTTCSHGGTLGAVRGDGVLRETGTGVTYGTVGQGTIAMLDRSANGQRNFSVSGWDHHWIKDGYDYYSGKGMSYLATTSWTVRINGSWGISATTRASGWGFIQSEGGRSGGWSLNGAGGSNTSNWPTWPTAGKSFSLYS
jgi:hypothetical protein